MLTITQINSPDDVPRITVQELKALLDANQTVVFDARQQRFFTRKHIVGAISLPQNRVANPPIRAATCHTILSRYERRTGALLFGRSGAVKTASMSASNSRPARPPT
ncbi:MAG: rhodanese-like domain-containing protein [Anaerolineae bacterium]|jgi:hypothetical protein